MNMLEKVQSQLEHLSKSERKVADVILAAPGRSIHLSIAMLAQEANVSEPTVNRFCRSMNTRGFPDFKLHLAQSLANGTPYVNRNVDEDDSVEAYTGKIFESAMASLDHVRQSLDKSAVNRAVDLLTQAKKIAFFGLGSSAAVAHDAMNKFFRFNVPVIYSDDIVLQRMSCMNCNDDDVVVLISHTGRTKSLGGTGAVGAGKRCDGDRPDLRWNAAGARSHAGHYPRRTGRYRHLYAHGLSTCSADRDRCAGNGIYFASRGKIQR
ncbi:DNA-binding transcriptional regulator HexR [Salmonella enterica subsp. enterica]|uniref:DNA-binding transcriptional regulator HexR n=1 Tax=Salmonella enterica I TaxID=59201 RepID=A0A447N8W7_SALET|nr:DNA-binding transcriptional regulator HexR [Salmonella enterica subsp. enterica]